MRLLLLAALALAVGGAKPKTSRDWSSLSDKDWERIEKEWEDPEEAEEYAFKPPQQKGIDMEKLKKTKDPKKVQAMVAESQQSAGPAMLFATVDYPGCCNKKQTEDITTKWSALLASAGLDANVYVIEDDQVLLSTQHGLHVNEIKEYVLKQPECVAVDLNSARTPGPAETEEWKARDAEKKAAKAKRDEATKAEKEKDKKTQEWLEKRKKKKRKAKKAARGKDEV